MAALLITFVGVPSSHGVTLTARSANGTTNGSIGAVTKFNPCWARADAPAYAARKVCSVRRPVSPSRVTK